MIPQSGSINVISTVTLGTTNLTGTLTGTVNTTNRTLLVVTSSPPVALDGIRTTAGLFLNNTTNFPAGCRVIAQQSPITFSYGGVSWATGTATLSTSAAMPMTSVAGQQFIITGSANSSLDGTYTTTSGGANAQQIIFSLAADPGAGFVGCTIRPGIVNSVAGTGNGCIGYYTVNMSNVISANITAGSLSTTTRTPTQVPLNTTHVIPTAATATNTFADLILDGVGIVTLPCLQLLSFKNLKSGTYIMANGGTATDVSKLVYATYNPHGNP